MRPNLLGKAYESLMQHQTKKKSPQSRNLRMTENVYLWMEPKGHYNLVFILYKLHCPYFLNFKFFSYTPYEPSYDCKLKTLISPCFIIWLVRTYMNHVKNICHLELASPLTKRTLLVIGQIQDVFNTSRNKSSSPNVKAM